MPGVFLLQFVHCLSGLARRCCASLNRWVCSGGLYTSPPAPPCCRHRPAPLVILAAVNIYPTVRTLSGVKSHMDAWWLMLCGVRAWLGGSRRLHRHVCSRRQPEWPGTWTWRPWLVLSLPVVRLLSCLPVWLLHSPAGLHQNLESNPESPTNS